MAIGDFLPGIIILSLGGVGMVITIIGSYTDPHIGLLMFFMGSLVFLIVGVIALLNGIVEDKKKSRMYKQ